MNSGSGHQALVIWNCSDMLSGIVILFLTCIISLGIIASFARKFPRFRLDLLKPLLFYHLILAIVYYLYAIFNPSDSHYYYIKLVDQIKGDNWFAYYSTSTGFIEFIGYPFVNYLGFSYEAMMCLFAFFGFVGFIYFYILFRENIRFKHTFAGYDLLLLLFYLPNLHFWSSSFGKGAVIFMGVGMFFYGLSDLRNRWITVGVAAILIYHIRPHILLVILVSSMIGFVFTTKGISVPLRIVFLLFAGTAFYFIYESVFQMVGVDENEFISQGLNLSSRARELSKTSSGVDIGSYSWPMKLFTFLFRPLFFDAPGLLGLVVSVENLFYLLFSLRLFSLSGLRYLLFSNFLIKTAFFSFLTVSIALAQISGNLGLAMRQKSQVMMLFMFFILSFLDQNKYVAYQRMRLARLRADRQKSVTGVNKAMP